MQPCCNMFLVLLFEMGLVSALTRGGLGLPEQDAAQNRRSRIHREIKVRAQIGRRKMRKPGERKETLLV